MPDFGAAAMFLLPHFQVSSWPYGRKERSHTILKKTGKKSDIKIRI
jgi:hypothetical protein